MTIFTCWASDDGKLIKAAKYFNEEVVVEVKSPSAVLQGKAVFDRNGQTKEVSGIVTEVEATHLQSKVKDFLDS